MTAQNFLRILSRFAPMATLLFVLHGCKGTESPDRVPMYMSIAVDVSDKSQQRLLAYASAAYRLQRGIGADDTVRIYEFAHEPELIYEGPPIRGRNEFNKKVASKFALEGASMDRKGTRTHLVLERLLTDTQSASCVSTSILLTDGGMEDLSPPVLELVRSSVTGLKGCPGFQRLLVAGVNQEWRSRWEEWIAPLGSGATVRGLSDMDQLSTDDMFGKE